MRVSVIIPHRNDLANLKRTLVTLFEADEVIIIDDASDIDQMPVDFSDRHRNLSMINNRECLGPGKARHMGVSLASGEVLVFCDSHMIFPVGWKQKVIDTMGYRNDLLGCSTYTTNKPFKEKMMKAQGATMAHFARNGEAWSVCDIQPLSPFQSDIDCPLISVPCVIGACYFMCASWYRAIGGLRGLSGYGAEEQLLSWKTWMAGGEVVCARDLEVMHINPDAPMPDFTEEKMQSYLLNKLYCERVVMGGVRFMQLVSSMDQWVLPFAHQAMGLPLPTALRFEVDPDAISERFGMQTISQGIELAGMIV